MKTIKLAMFQIMTFITIAVAHLVYFAGGTPEIRLTSAYFMTVAPGLASIALLAFVLFLVSLSFVVSRALHRKNLLRMSMVILFLMILGGIVFRIMEITAGVWFIAGLIYTVLLILLFVLLISIMKDLHKLVKILFK